MFSLILLGEFAAILKCDLCDEEARVYLTQIVEGKMQKVNLCESCAQEKGVTDPTGFALADLLVGVGTTEEVEQESVDQQCPECDFTRKDFKHTGRLGCPSCYETFEEGLESLLKAMHKGTTHVGKVPQKYAKSVAVTLKLESLQEALQEAVSTEAYEEAAKLRDEIQELVGVDSGGGELGLDSDSLGSSSNGEHEEQGA